MSASIAGNAGQGIGGNAISSGSGTPGGSPGQIQINNSGTFGGVATTGTGNAVLSDSPSLTTPALGTPSALILTNATGLPASGLAATTGTTNVVVLQNAPTLTGLTTGSQLSLTNSASLVPLLIGTVPILSAAVGGGNTTSVCFGNNAGGMGGSVGNNSWAWTTTGTENVLLGNNSGAFLNPAVAGQGAQNTYVGQTTGAQDVAGAQNTAIGNDCMRDATGNTGCTALGKHAHAYLSSCSDNVAIGAYALIGNQRSITIGGTITTGDVINITFTSASIPSFPVTVSYTVLSSDTTLAILTTSVANAIKANATVATYYNAVINQVPTVIVIESGNLNVGSANYPLTVTTSVTGAGTETATVTLGPTGTTNFIAIGAFALNGAALATGAGSLIAIGTSAGQSVTTATTSIYIGTFAALNATSGTGNVFAGHNSGQMATTASNNVGVGLNTLFTLVTNGACTGVGANAGQHTTAANQTLIGASAGVNLTSGGSNTAVGASALAGGASSTASFNCVVGSNSFSAASTATKNNSLGFGNGAALTTGGSNIFLGFAVCGSTLTTGSNNWVVSTNATSADVATSSTSNTVAFWGNTTTAWFTASNTNATSCAATFSFGNLALGVSSTYGGTLTLFGSSSGSATITGGTAGVVTISGGVVLGAQSTFASSTTGSATQTFTNSPATTSTTTAQWIPVSITGQTGTFYIPAVH